MAENSGIEWTDHTFNPWMGCTKVSPACKNCYAERDFDHRYKKVNWGPSGERRMTTDANWNKPIKWNREATASRPRVFCASLADVFEDWQGPILDHNATQLFTHDNGNIVRLADANVDAPYHREATMDDLRKRLWALIDATPNLDWLLLTKRPENFDRMWDRASRENVLLGTSIENQEWADKRLSYLHNAKRYGFVSKTFVSAEPLVGGVILQGNANGKTYNHLGDGGLDWVITGGESGPAARPCEPDWFRSLRDQCEATGTPFHFKQWGEFDEHQNRVGKKNAGRLLDGKTHDGVPLQSVAA